jgi:protein-tyrosine-phosphatase
MAAAMTRRFLGAAAHVESGGLDAAERVPATKHAVAVMQEMGFDITKHRSRDIERIDWSAFELVIAMAPFIGQRLLEFGIDPNKIAQLNVPDPYGKGLNVYRSTAVEIARQLKTLFGIDEE